MLLPVISTDRDDEELIANSIYHHQFSGFDKVLQLYKMLSLGGSWVKGT